MVKHIFILFILLLTPFVNSFSQVVVPEPAIPTDVDLTTITFDATKGDAGLKDFNTAGTNNAVYAHIGVVTNLSTPDTLWQHVKSA